MKTRVKRNDFESKQQNDSGNPKKTWEILQSLLPNKSFQNMQIGQACDPADSLQKANRFNEFYCSIGKELAKKAFFNHQIKYSTYLRNSISYIMYLEPPTTNEIINCIDSLNMNKAVGHDNILAYFLKIAATTLAPYLRSFFDFVFTHGIFPDVCKIPKIVHIHKKGENDNPSNCKPISILNCFSKILEKMIHQRILPFSNKHKILTPQQIGFQKKSFNYACSAKFYNSNL